MNNRLQIISFILVILFTACGGVYAGRHSTPDKNLLDHLNKYYKLEMTNNWERTYSFRTPLYQGSVPFKLYREEMTNDNDGWKLMSPSGNGRKSLAFRRRL